MPEVLIPGYSAVQIASTGLGVQQLMYDCDNEELAVLLATTAPASTCPVCQLDSARVHSRYRRTLLDLPLAVRPVRLQLQVRRFFCSTSDCPRYIFAERVPALAQPYAHRTSRMATALQHVGLALGGRAGSRLAADLLSWLHATSVLNGGRFPGLATSNILLDYMFLIGAESLRKY